MIVTLSSQVFQVPVPTKGSAGSAGASEIDSFAPLPLIQRLVAEFPSVEEPLHELS